MERNTLIDQLKQLTPTEGEEKWQDSYGIIDNGEVVLFDRIDATTDDCTLVALAPQMRLSILEMAKEIEELKEDLHRINLLNKHYSNFRNEVLEIPDELIKQIDDKYFPF